MDRGRLADRACGADEPPLQPTLVAARTTAKLRALGFGGHVQLASLSFCVAAAPLLIAAEQPVRLQPSTAWNVEYAENSCRLSRLFGNGDDAVMLSFESEAPDQVDMLVLGKKLKIESEIVDGQFLPVQLRPIRGHVAQSSVGNAVLWTRVRLLPEFLAEKQTRGSDDRDRAHSQVRPPPIDLAEKAEANAMHLEFANQVTEIEVDARRNHPLILETGSLGKAIEAFDKCDRDSLRDWGVDPDLEDKIVRRPWSPKVRSWFSSTDYPLAMLEKFQEADVKVRLLVDATGKVTHCTSLSHFKEKSFNAVICDAFMKRAHFEPAELADGTKVPSYYVNHIYFGMRH